MYLFYSVLAMQSKRTPNISEVKYYNRSIVRFPGEWILIDCQYPIHTRSLLLFKPQFGMNHTKFHQRFVDHQKIKLVSNDVYNITNLTYDDSGIYKCTARISPTFLSLNLTREVLVLKGKNRQLLFIFGWIRLVSVVGLGLQVCISLNFVFICIIL